MIIYTTIHDQEFRLSLEEDQWVMNDQPLKIDYINLSPGHIHLLHQNKSYQMECLQIDKEAKTIVVRVNNKIHRVAWKNQQDKLLEKIGIHATATSTINDIKAPMPGLIAELKVKPGDQIKKGDPLIVLEAMKMENVLNSPCDHTVKSISVKKGDHVEKGQKLITF